MADNTTLNAGSGGDTYGSDDIGGVKYQRVKLIHGADGTNDGDVSSANGLPVSHSALTELAAAIDTEVQCDIVGALPAGTNAIGKLAANSGVDIGDVDVISLPSTVHSADFDTGAGTDTTLAFGIAVPASGGAAVVPGDATAGLKVDLGADNDVTVTGSVTANAGTNLNTSALALESGGNLAGAATSLAVMDDWDNAASDGASVSGDVAHDDPDAGEPVKQGAKATTALSGITLVANNDRTNLFAGVDGVLITRPTTGLEDIVSGNTSNTDGTSTQVIAASGSASVKTYLTAVTLTNTSASMIYVELKSGTTVRWTCPVPATGGYTFTFNPPLPPNAANEAWSVDASAATTTLYASMLGFKSKV